MADPTPDLPTLAREMSELMSLLHSVPVSQTLEIWAEHELTMPQLIALHILHAGGPHSVSGIQGHLRLSASTTSHMVDRLVSKGFVDRTEDPSDRRQKLVAITAAGAELLQTVTTARNEQIVAGLSLLPAPLLDDLRAASRAAIDHLRSQDKRVCPGS